jgi:hypothetical protein
MEKVGRGKGEEIAGEEIIILVGKDYCGTLA